MPISYQEIGSKNRVVIDSENHKQLNHFYFDERKDVNCTFVFLIGNEKGGRYSFDYGEEFELTGGKVLVIEDKNLILRGGTSEELEQPLK